MGKLDGRVAVVTGAGRGLGREHALALAAEGASVIVNDLGGGTDGTGGELGPAEEVASAIRAGGGRAVADGASVTESAAASGLVQTALREYGRIDIVVNNAGILRDRMSFNLDDEDFDAVLKVHLYGHFYLARAAAAHWRERSKAGDSITGRIVNTASESGLFGNAGQINYAAAKAGIAAMTIVMARELERYGVTVNAIAPRAATRLISQTPDPATAQGGPMDPANVAPWVVFLCTDEAANITGQVFTVWGGRVQRVQGWTPADHIDTEGRWTIDQLKEAAPRLFPDGRSGVPPFYPLVEFTGAAT
jgi:NAD(P)-dependent dehydrogenase (short-subunit alcohol dehydrogenase family)